MYVGLRWVAECKQEHETSLLTSRLHCQVYGKVHIFKTATYNSFWPRTTPHFCLKFYLLFFFDSLNNPQTDQRQDWLDVQVIRLIAADYLDPLMSYRLSISCCTKNSTPIIHLNTPPHTLTPPLREGDKAACSGGEVAEKWAFFFFTLSEMKSNKWRKKQHRWGS